MRFYLLILVSLVVPGCSNDDQQRITDLEDQIEETRVAEVENQLEETRVAEVERQLEGGRIAKLEEDRKKHLEFQRTGGGERVVTRHYNGQKKSEGHMLDDGTAVGFWTYWYENGLKKGEGTYKDGKEDGVWTEWYENGEKRWEETYKSGARDGVWTYWYENGLKSWEETYKIGDSDGVWTEWYENGHKASEEAFKGGLLALDRVSLRYHENGHKKSEETYKNGEPDGVWTYWYENGPKRSEQTYKNGVLAERIDFRWDSNGQKLSEQTYKNGVLVERIEFSWYSNGQKSSEQTYKYKNGERTAREFLSTEWYENGHKKAEGTSKGVGRYGVWIDWDEDGNTHISRGYGVWTWWDADAQMHLADTTSAVFTAEMKDGVWTDWDKDGQKQWELTFKNGKRDGVETQWNENGQKRLELTYKNGEKDGVETYWYENGRKWYEHTFKNGKMDGLWTWWHDNGQKHREGTYKDGERDGVWTEYDRSFDVEIEDQPQVNQIIAADDFVVPFIQYPSGAWIQGVGEVAVGDEFPGDFYAVGDKFELATKPGVRLRLVAVERESVNINLVEGDASVTVPVSTYEVPITAKDLDGREIVVPQRTRMTAPDHYSVGSADAAELEQMSQEQVLAAVPVRTERDPFTNEVKGLRIRSVQPNSVFARMGVQADDIVLEVNGVAAADRQQVFTSFENISGGKIEVKIERMGGIRTLVFTVQRENQQNMERDQDRAERRAEANDRRVERMAEELGLNSSQTEQFAKITGDASEKRNAFFSDMRENGWGSVDRDEIRSQMETMRDEESSQLEGVLTPEQMTQYEESNNRGMFGNTGGGRGNDF